jgi:hypothetical protein
MRYLLVSFYKKSNNQIDEQIGFSKRLKKTDESMCNIILDYKERRVVKSVINGSVFPTSFEKMHDYYSKIYPQLIEQLELINKDTAKNQKPA